MEIFLKAHFKLRSTRNKRSFFILSQITSSLSSVLSTLTVTRSSVSGGDRWESSVTNKEMTGDFSRQILASITKTFPSIDG